MLACYVEEGGSARIDFTFAGGRKEDIAKRVTVLPYVVDSTNLEEHKEELKDVEIILATWEISVFTKEQIQKYFPSLKAVLYAAASVQRFARPYLELGIQVSSAQAPMAISVAEMTLALIIECSKGFFVSNPMYRKTRDYSRCHKFITTTYPGLYEQTPIGILGMGAIGRLVTKYLSAFDVKVLAFDPFLSEEEAKELGVEKTSLENIFKECDVISNHIANRPETVGMLKYEHFSQMKPTAAFINTGRGAQVVEEDLARAMREVPTRSAVLDVTTEEPYNGELWDLENVYILPHIAGFSRKEVWRFPDFVIRQIDHLLANEPLEGTVTLEKLKTMA